jgi:glycyl-tRNA synthetase
MFVDFKNVVDTGRVKLPFGIAQIGKSFRNEITPRNFIFRSREFEQMEMEYFIHEDADWAKCHQEWISGAPLAHLHRPARVAPLALRPPEGEARVLLQGHGGHHVQVSLRRAGALGHRRPRQLRPHQHAKASGKPQEIFDEATKKKFVPHVIEPAVGVDRIFLAVLCAAYAEEDVKDEKGNVEKRTVLRLSPRIAPVKVAVLPLLKNKEQLVEPRPRALQEAAAPLRRASTTTAGAIGRRYRRQDEIGTPWCVTIDFDTIEKARRHLHPPRARLDGPETHHRGRALRAARGAGLLSDL